MLWTKLTEDGELIIQADEPLEAYALKQWEKQRKAGKASIKIETGTRIDIESLVKSLGTDLANYRKWARTCKDSAILDTELADQALGKST